MQARLDVPQMNDRLLFAGLNAETLVSGESEMVHWAAKQVAADSAC